MSVLHHYERIAHALARVSVLLWVVTAVSAATFVAVMLFSDGSQDERYLLICVSFALWSLSLIGFARAFSQPMPAVDPSESFFRRMRSRLGIAARWVMALLMTVLLGVVIAVTLRALLIIT